MKLVAMKKIYSDYLDKAKKTNESDALSKLIDDMRRLIDQLLKCIYYCVDNDMMQAFSINTEAISFCMGLMASMMEEYEKEEQMGHYKTINKFLDSTIDDMKILTDVVSKKRNKMHYMGIMIEVVKEYRDVSSN